MIVVWMGFSVLIELDLLKSNQINIRLVISSTGDIGSASGVAESRNERQTNKSNAG